MLITAVQIILRDRQRSPPLNERIRRDALTAYQHPDIKCQLQTGARDKHTKSCAGGCLDAINSRSCEWLLITQTQKLNYLDGVVRMHEQRQ